MSVYDKTGWNLEEALDLLSGEELSDYRELIDRLDVTGNEREGLIKLLTSYEALSDRYEAHKAFIEESIDTDPTYKINNRKSMLRIIEREWEGSKRYHSPSSLIMLSIDNMIGSGSVIGEVVAVELAHLIKNSTRMTDAFGRIDADKFIIVVPTTNNVQAAWLSQKLRETIQSTTFDGQNEITCSFGLADSDASMNPEDWLAIAETAHKKAVDRGGNQVVDFEEM